jgi:hypothetical protein
MVNNEEVTMQNDQELRAHLRRTLDWEDAHVNFETAVKDVPEEMCGVQAKGLPYSIWQLVEHIRICQNDILDFCINKHYEEKEMEEYWPKTTMPPSEESWNQSLTAYRKDRDALKELASDASIDLFARIPHGQGQTYLRELLLVADHNAYHVAEIVAVRRVLGIWK